MMMNRTFKKLYGQLASLRDYELAEAKKHGGCVFIYKKWKMTLSADELSAREFQCHKRFIPSKIQNWRNPLTGMSGYSFIDFVFKPDGGECVTTESSKGIKSSRNRAGASKSSKKVVEAKPKSGGATQGLLGI